MVRLVEVVQAKASLSVSWSHCSAPCLACAAVCAPLLMWTLNVPSDDRREQPTDLDGMSGAEKVGGIKELTLLVSLFASQLTAQLVPQAGRSPFAP